MNYISVLRPVEDIRQGDLIAVNIETTQFGTVEEIRSGSVFIRLLIQYKIKGNIGQILSIEQRWLEFEVGDFIFIVKEL